MALPVVIPNTFANANASIPLSQLDNNFSTVAVAINGMANGAEALANVNITGGSIANASLSNVSISSGNVTINVANVTTLDATNVEVTNIKAKDGTASATIADSTGVMTIGSSVLTTADINGGTIDGTAIGGSTPAAGAFTTLSATGNATLSNSTAEIQFTGATYGWLRATVGDLYVDAPTAKSIFLRNAGSTIATVSSTGLSVTGTLSATGAIRGTFFDSAVIYGGADNDNFTAVYGTSHPSLPNQWEVTLDGANRARITTTGLSVTGTLSSTGNFTVNTNVVSLSASAGANALVLDASGNVGIGTASGSQAINIARGAGLGAGIEIAGNGNTIGSGGVFVGQGNDNFFYLYQRANHPMLFGTNNTERMRIDASGNVLIGTASSALGGVSNLELASSKSGGTVDALVYNGSNTASSNARIWISNAGTSSGTAGLLITSGLAGTRWAVGVDSTDSDKFKISNGYVPGSGSTFLTINSSGSVGIGTTSPATRLDIRGGGGTANTIRIGSDTNDTGTIEFFNTVSSTVNSTITANLEGGNAGGDIRFSTKSVAGSLTERMRIDSSGNVLLGGTATPASATASLAIFNGTAPTGSVTNGIVLYAEDVSSSSELKVRDEAGNVTTLSPHNFSLIPDGPSEDMAWAYYSERNGKRINVDMLKLARMIEKLTGEKLVYEG